MDSAQALHNFWSGFSWTAYDSSTVPSSDLNPDMPRITYDVSQSEFDETVNMSASLWDRSFSWSNITSKAEEIYNAIGLGGVLVEYDDGKIWIKRGSPFAQRMSDSDDTVRRIYINIEVEYLTTK